MHHTTDESDETLSFCDLPLYSDQSVEDWQQDFCAESQDYFEFSSQELTPSTTGFPPENIIFCGKIIPYKKHQDTSNRDSSTLVETRNPTNTTRKRSWGILRSMFGLSRNNKKGTCTSLMHRDKSANNMYNSSNKGGKEYNNDLPVHKMSILASSSSGKARWCLFLFGVPRLASEVEMSGFKRRLSRRHSSSPPPSPAVRGSSGLSGLIRVLSCGGDRHPNAMVAAPTSFSREE